MRNPNYMISLTEKTKRISIAKKELERFESTAIGVILAGSVAYSTDEHITPKSDIDLIIVAKEIRTYIDMFIEDELERKKLRNRFFEGYCFKKSVEDIPVSYHILSIDAFDIISKCFVADIRLYRQKPKEEEYSLFGFDGKQYNYWIKNIPLDEFEDGVRTIIPIGFINEDRYYLGIHRDKLISNPLILHDPKELIAKGINRLWRNISQILYDESMRLHGGLNLNKMNIINMLAKRQKMSQEVLTDIECHADKHITSVQKKMKRMSI
jgi:predicted nucleotidyltransferase